MGKFCVYKVDFSIALLEVMHIIVFHKEMHKYLFSAERTKVVLTFLEGCLLSICKPFVWELKVLGQ